MLSTQPNPLPPPPLHTAHYVYKYIPQYVVTQGTGGEGKQVNQWEG